MLICKPWEMIVSPQEASLFLRQPSLPFKRFPLMSECVLAFPYSHPLLGLNNTLALPHSLCPLSPSSPNRPRSRLPIMHPLIRLIGSHACLPLHHDRVPLNRPTLDRTLSNSPHYTHPLSYPPFHLIHLTLCLCAAQLEAQMDVDAQ